MTLLLVACASPSVDDSATAPVLPVDIATPSTGWLRGDLHFHTNYSDDALEQNGDWMTQALTIADAWRAPEWVERFPEYAPTDHLQFVAVTDHRTTAGWADPDFGHDYLAVVGGEEYGSDGHAGIWGHDAHIPHEPQGGESATERIQASIDEAHAQGGLFSVNHPLYSGDLWAWDVTGFDGVEVWNSAWSVMGRPTTEPELDQWLLDRGIVENPWIRAAVRTQGVTQNAQALRFWQALLGDGILVPPVGGGDRHMIFPAGLPTTYVLAEPTASGVVAGLDAGHTFVSRGPQGPQVVLTTTLSGVTYLMGSELPLAPTIDIQWEVGRAREGEIQFWQGTLGGDPVLAATLPVESDHATGTWPWTVPAEGGWLHAVVVDPLPADVPTEHEALVDVLTTFPDTDGLGALVTAMGAMVDLSILATPAECDPAAWDEWSAMCMPADQESWATFYIPPKLQALMSTDFRDGAATGYAMGAISSAFLVRGE